MEDAHRRDIRIKVLTASTKKCDYIKELNAIRSKLDDHLLSPNFSKTREYQSISIRNTFIPDLINRERGLKSNRNRINSNRLKSPNEKSHLRSVNNSAVLNTAKYNTISVKVHESSVSPSMDENASRLI